MLKIKEMRKEKKISGPKLAAMLHITPTHLYDMENGKKRIHSEMLSAIADILKTSTDYLLGRTEDPSPPNTNYKKPNFEEYVLSAPNLPEALQRVAELVSQFNIDEKTFIELSTKARDKYGSPKAVKTEPAAHNEENMPGTGVFENNSGDDTNARKNRY
ncbi:MAG TPA: hypothetical protein DEF34_10295 [Desulfotomaculum sp.]|nr:hypothetical protein [Desulfotomaculum sp.]